MPQLDASPPKQRRPSTELQPLLDDIKASLRLERSSVATVAAQRAQLEETFRMRRDREASSAQSTDLMARARAAFHVLDGDASGTLSPQEIAAYFGGEGTDLFKRIDANADGEISMEEWLEFMRGLEADQGSEALQFFIRSLERRLAGAKSVLHMIDE